MAWTTPRTWVAGEVVTAALMNAHHKANFDVLKVTRDVAGRLKNLSSTTLANLAATNLTGLVNPAAANNYTAGRTTYGGTSTVVIPIGANKWTGTKGINARGIWIEGSYVHHIDKDKTTEWRFLGTYIKPATGAVIGSAWIEGEKFNFVDSSGDHRQLSTAGVGAVHSDASAIGGSVWIEDYLHWIIAAGVTEAIGHADISHSDGTAHFNTHSDSIHQDSHTDTGHEDDYTDVTHVDNHTDNHTDTYTDSFPIDFHRDTYADAYVDVSHVDDHDDISHVDAHADTPHTDVHADHTDYSDIAEQVQPVAV